MEKLVSIYVDRLPWDTEIKPDDFLVTIGQKQSNSVYHCAESRKVEQKNKMNRFYLKCFRSDLVTALHREKQTQQLITVFWYKR